MSEQTRSQRTSSERDIPLRRTLALVAIGVSGLVGLHFIGGPNSSSAAGPEVVMEYPLKAGDTAWTLANRAFPGDAGDPNHQFDVRNEIIEQGSNDSADGGPSLVLGRVLVFDGSSKIGHRTTYEKALEDRLAALDHQSSVSVKDVDEAVSVTPIGS